MTEEHAEWIIEQNAKGVLGGSVCIAGDVPNNLPAVGTPGEVAEYCKKLVQVVGDGGGFVTFSGCAVPVDAKPENVRAMIETVLAFGGY